MIQKQFSHFIQRAKERYDLDLDLKDLQVIAETIKSGRAKLTQFDSKSARYKVRVKSKLMVVVLDRQHAHFITALPVNKYTESSSFNGKSYTYKDALYMNWLFSKYFNSSNIVCPVCGSTEIVSDLGYNRFKCLHCYNLTKFEELEEQNPLISIIENGVATTALHLSLDFWWYLYLSNKKFKCYSLKIEPVLQNDDDFGYIITYKKKVSDVPLGTYTINNLRRIVNDRTN